MSRPGVPWLRWRWVLALALGTAIGILFLAVDDPRAALAVLLERTRSLGIAGYLLFIVLYVAATVCLLPASILTLGAGAAFGLPLGFVLVSIASVLGAITAFLVGRYLARGWVSSRFARNRLFAAIDRAVAAEGWKIVGLTRLSPVFPFVLLNYAFGITRVRLRDYIVASWIGMIPGTLLYVYAGAVAGEAAAARERSIWEWALYATGLAATVAVTVLVTRAARRALDARLAESEKRV